MLVQPLGELFEHRVQWIRRHSLNDQLAARHADGQRIAITDEEHSQPVGYPVNGDIQEGMLLRINRVLVEGDRELDQEVR